MPGATQPDQRYRVQSLDRACDILECLADYGPDMALSQITSAVGLSKTTVHRLLSALEGRNYVYHQRSAGKYSLGNKLFELGLKAMDEDRIAALARPRLAQLAEATGETAHLGVLRAGEVVSICAVEGPRTLTTPSTVGRRAPAHSSSQGKCMLALAPREQIDSMLAAPLPRFTRNTITTASRMRRELALVRRQGYAVDSEEFERGLKCIGAPVIDGVGTVRGSVSIAGPAGRMGPEEMPYLIQAVKDAASGLSADLGRVPGSRNRRGEGYNALVEDVPTAGGNAPGSQTPAQGSNRVGAA